MGRSLPHITAIAPLPAAGALCASHTGAAGSRPFCPLHTAAWNGTIVKSFGRECPAFCAPQSPLCRGRWHGAAVTKVIIPSRLPASQSHTKGFGLYACRRGGTFAPPKVPKGGLGQAPRPRRTGTPARNGYAVPKRGLNGAYRESATHFYRLPRWSAEWRTTTPVPSSEEGDCGERLQTPFISQFDQ